MRIKYEDWKPRRQTEELINHAERIIEAYRQDGYTLTLRQLYYQFVSEGLIENTERSYKNLGSTITKARLAGLISWRSIEDRGRTFNSVYVEEDIQSLIDNLPAMVAFDFWDNQPCYIEVWVEKEALGNVVSKACDKYRLPHMACKGYLSASEAWRAGMRFEEQIAHGKKCVLFHLGDHDPSGLDMTRDNAQRLELFAGESVEVIRLALNMDQIDQYNPPPNPAKITDSRAKSYIDKYGKSSWELDALRPSIIEKLIQGHAEDFIDFDAWENKEKEENAAIESLRKLSVQFNR